MPQPLVYDTIEITKMMEDYKSIAISAFNYLNGRVNPNNPCILYLEHFSACNFAEFRKPNIISIELGSIINNVKINEYTNDYIIGLILVCVCHELAHADQAICMCRYNIDVEYQRYIEMDAENKCRSFLFRHAREIQSSFGIDIIKAINAYTIEGDPNIAPKVFDMREHYVTSLVDVLIRDINMLKPIDMLFDFDNVHIIIDGENIYVKKRGSFVRDSLQHFNRILNSYRSKGMIFSLNIKMHSKKEIKDGRLRSVSLYIDTSNLKITPVKING